MQVFLCHSSTDKPVVTEIYHWLRVQGFWPWLDVESLVPGQDWAYEIHRAIYESGVVVVLLSQESVTRTGFVQREIRVALDAALERPEDQVFVIPARLEPCAVPLRLRHLHTVDLFVQGGYDRLLNGLNVARRTTLTGGDGTYDAMLAMTQWVMGMLM